MAQDLIQIRHKGQTVFSTENPLAKMGLTNTILNLDAKATDVTLTTKDGESYKATKFTLNKLAILKIMGDAYFLWLQKGTEIFVRKV